MRSGRQRTVALHFLKMLLQLNSSGMPLGDTLKILSHRLKDQRQKALSSSLWRELSEEKILSEAMSCLPQYFNENMIHLIQAGEATGNLAPILTEIVKISEDSAAMSRKIRAGLAYPILISCMTLGVVALFIYVLLPKIQDMIATLGG